MKTLTSKRQALLNSIWSKSAEGYTVVIHPTDLMEAKVLEQVGFISLTSFQLREVTYYAAVLNDPRQAVIEEVQSYVAHLQAACQALREGSDPNVLLDLMGEVREFGPLENLHRALLDRVAKLVKEQEQVQG